MPSISRGLLEGHDFTHAAIFPQSVPCFLPRSWGTALGCRPFDDGGLESAPANDGVEASQLLPVCQNVPWLSMTYIKQHRVNSRRPSAVGAGEPSLLDVSHRGGKLGMAVHNCDLSRLWSEDSLLKTCFPLIAWPTQRVGEIHNFISATVWELTFGFPHWISWGQPSTTVDPEQIVPPPKNFTLLIPLHLSSPILIYQRHPPMLNRAESIVTLQHPLRPNWLQHWSDPLCTAPQLAQGAPSHDVKRKTHSKKYEPLLVQARAVKKEPMEIYGDHHPAHVQTFGCLVGCLCTCSGVSVE